MTLDLDTVAGRAPLHGALVAAAQREFGEAARASAALDGVRGSDGKRHRVPCGCPKYAHEREHLCAVHGRLADAWRRLEEARGDA